MYSRFDGWQTQQTPALGLNERVRREAEKGRDEANGWYGVVAYAAGVMASVPICVVGWTFALQGQWAEALTTWALGAFWCVGARALMGR